MTSLSLGAPAAIGFGEKIWRINWGLVLVLTLIAGIGSVALYSAAGGHFEPWAAKHAMRYGIALGLMLVVALVHPKVWLSLAWPLYIASLLLLVAVDIAGKIGMGAQRWLVIGPMQIQPSEIAKVAVILVLGFVAPAFFVTKQLDVTKAQAGVQQILTDETNGYGAKNVKDVKCNGGKNPEVKKGGSFDCNVSIDGAPRKVTVTFQDDKGTYEVGRPSQ